MEEAHNAYLFGLQVGAEHFVETDAYKALIAELWAEYISGYQAGFVDGYFTDSEQIAPFMEILTDLIAELRELRCACDCDDCEVKGGPQAVNRAEERLREIGGGDADV